MAAQKSKKTETHKQVTERPRAAISVHPRVARMKRLGTYHLQAPGVHSITTHDIAEATEKAYKVMEAERQEAPEVAPESPVVVEEDTPKASKSASNMADSVSGDALRQEESKSEQRRKAELKHSSESGLKNKSSDKTSPAPQVDSGTKSSEPAKTGPADKPAKK